MKERNNTGSNQASVEKLIADFNCNDIRILEKSRLCLLAMGERAVPKLVEALSDQSKTIRWEAAKALAEMRNPSLAPILTQGLENKDPDIRWLSAEGLLALGRDGLSPLLSALIEKPTAEFLLQGAHHILSDLCAKRRHEGEAEYYSLTPLDDVTRELLKPVVKALEADEPSHTLPPLAKAALTHLNHIYGDSHYN